MLKNHEGYETEITFKKIKIKSDLDGQNLYKIDNFSYKLRNHSH